MFSNNAEALGWNQYSWRNLLKGLFRQDVSHTLLAWRCNWKRNPWHTFFSPSNLSVPFRTRFFFFFPATWASSENWPICDRPRSRGEAGNSWNFQAFIHRRRRIYVPIFHCFSGDIFFSSSKMYENSIRTSKNRGFLYILLLECQKGQMVKTEQNINQTNGSNTLGLQHRLI